MSQIDAFNPGAPAIFPRARATDAISSHQAAAELESSGRARLQAERVLAALRKYPNTTSRELAEYAGLDRHEVGRRLPDLHEVHLVARYDVTPLTAPCAFTGKRAVRWCPA